MERMNQSIKYSQKTKTQNETLRDSSGRTPLQKNNEQKKVAKSSRTNTTNQNTKQELKLGKISGSSQLTKKNTTNPLKKIN